jgi:hypothetical protein
MDGAVRSFPKIKPVRLTGNAMRVLRFECFKRDGGRCAVCGCLVSFSGKSTKYPPMHMAHKRSKRLYGDVLSNVETRCAHDHLVTGHNPKSVPPKGLPNADRREA